MEFYIALFTGFLGLSGVILGAAYLKRTVIDLFQDNG